jgi:hypothetical protein
MSKTTSIASLSVAAAFWCGFVGVALGQADQSPKPGGCPGVTATVTYCFTDEKAKDTYFEALKKASEKFTPKMNEAGKMNTWDPNGCQGGCMYMILNIPVCCHPLQW